MRAERGRDPKDPWLRASRSTLEVVTGGSYAAFLLAHAQLEPTGPNAALTLYWLVAAAVILLPLLVPLLKQVRELDRQRELSFRIASLLTAALLISLLDAASIWHSLLAGFTLVLGSLLTSYRTSRAAAWLLALAPAQVLCAMAAAPSDGWLLHLPVVIGAVCVGALVQSARHASRHLRERAPRRLLRDMEQRKPERGERRARWAVAVPLWLSMLALTALIYPALASIPHPELRPKSRATQGDAAQADTTARADEALGSGEAGRLFREEISPGGALSEQSQEVVMTVKPRRSAVVNAPSVRLGTLYLRGACLDTYTERGMRSFPGSAPELLTDADDGRGDGWTMLAYDEPRAPIWFDIQQQSFRTAGGTWDVLFAPQPVLALRAMSVHYDPDGLLAFRRSDGGAMVEYTLVCESRGPAQDSLREAAADHAQARYVQLPRRDEDLIWIERIAREQTAGADNDLARVEAVLDYFATEYEYSLRTHDVPGIEGILSFMRRKQGHCTSFAATAVLMLRSLGLSSRVATGFMASQWSEEDSMYLVSTRNGHAWIEVWFEGLGWQQFDPTPAGAREAAHAAADLGQDDGLTTWWSYMRGDMAAWAQSGADEGELDLLMSTLADLPRALWASVRRYPARASAALVVLAALVLSRIARRRERARAALASGSLQRFEPSTLAQALIAALHQRGLERAAGETLQELARRHLAEHPDADLEFAVSALYRARFAGRGELEREERSRIGAWIANV